MPELAGALLLIEKGLYVSLRTVFSMNVYAPD
jgi:hypothetical protein